MIKELLEKEICSQGYTFIKWTQTLKYGWGAQVEKNGFYTTIFVDELAHEMFAREMRAISKG